MSGQKSDSIFLDVVCQDGEHTGYTVEMGPTTVNRARGRVREVNEYCSNGALFHENNRLNSLSGNINLLPGRYVYVLSVPASDAYRTKKTAASAALNAALAALEASEIALLKNKHERAKVERLARINLRYFSYDTVKEVTFAAVKEIADVQLNPKLEGSGSESSQPTAPDKAPFSLLTSNSTGTVSSLAKCDTDTDSEPMDAAVIASDEQRAQLMATNIRTESSREEDLSEEGKHREAESIAAFERASKAEQEEDSPDSGDTN